MNDKKTFAGFPLRRLAIIALTILLFAVFTPATLAQDSLDRSRIDAVEPQTVVLMEEVDFIIDDRPLDETELSYFVRNLPDGLRFNAEEASITGRPRETGTFALEFVLDDNLERYEQVRRLVEWTVILPEFELPDEKHSVARNWNEVLLAAIRKDFARPTVHARNLYYLSSVMYDAWAIYDDTATPYFLGGELNGVECPLPRRYAPPSGDVAAARHETLSYAAYRLLSSRFTESPGHPVSQARFDHVLATYGYDMDNTSTDVTDGSAASLGNYIAECYIGFGFSDGANELANYESRFYEPFNPPIPVDVPIANLEWEVDAVDTMNRWVPLEFDLFIGQSDIEAAESTPEFVSPEWGAVVPFALSEEDRTIYERDGNEYWVYHDPGEPPLFGTDRQDEAVWGFMLVPQWAAYLDPADGTMIDISPASNGNNERYEASFDFYQAYYSPTGGDTSPGHTVNPITGQPYPENMVLQADYARVLAEFWADGPDSETPPGHWFTILNTVNDHPQLEKRYMGEGERLSDLEWDIKTYFSLGGAMHDAAISAWGAKGWYDYARPISAVRLMAYYAQEQLGHEFGMPLIPGSVEIVTEDDPLAGPLREHVGKLKLWTWLGPDAIEDPETDVAGVGWILAENWWPYQRPTFVTPPFAGYVSGHSTYSRAAAEVMAAITGDPFFPGGVGEFVAEKDEFLVFEDGPSETVTLQWATYKDAADQSGLSRIYGGIHPPADDMPGRIIGISVGQDAFALADQYFSGEMSSGGGFAFGRNAILIGSAVGGTLLLGLAGVFVWQRQRA